MFLPDVQGSIFCAWAKNGRKSSNLDICSSDDDEATDLETETETEIESEIDEGKKQHDEGKKQHDDVDDGQKQEQLNAMEPVIEESSTVTTSTEVNIYKVDEEERRIQNRKDAGK